MLEKTFCQLLLKAGSGWGLPLLFVLFTFWQKIYPEDKSRHLHLQVNKMKPSKPEKSLRKRVFKHGRMQSNTPANGLAHDLFSKRYVLINRVLGHGGPQAGNYCRGFCVFCVVFFVVFSDTDAIGQPSREFFTEG